MALPDPAQISNPLPGTSTTLEVAVPVASAPVWQAVALTSDVDVQPNDTTATFSALQDAWDYVVKTGMGGTLTFKTAARDDDPAQAILLAAGDGLGDDAVLFYRVGYPDGSYYSGNISVKRPHQMTGARAVYEYDYSCDLTGPQVRTSAADAAA